MDYDQMTSEETTQGAFVDGTQLVFIDDAATVREKTIYIE
jgi:hypothetical protein